MATKPGERKLAILHTLAQMLENPKGEKITTAALAARLDVSEAALYRLLTETLPATTVVSIGHRSTLEAFHERNVVLTRDGDRFALQDQGKGGKPL